MLIWLPSVSYERQRCIQDPVKHLRSILYAIIGYNIGNNILECNKRSKKNTFKLNEIHQTYYFVSCLSPFILSYMIVLLKFYHRKILNPTVYNMS